MTAVSVLTITFEQDDQAFAGMTELSELSSQGQLKLRDAAVVTRDAAGKVHIKDKVGGSEYMATATGGILGLLIGVIGGPLGVLVGGAAGLGLGAAIDLEEDEGAGSVLAAISQRVRVGSNALLAEVEEQSPEVVDAAMAKLHGAVLRQSLIGVEAEIAAAEDVQREAHEKAKAQLREERRRADHEKVEAKIAALKAKLGQHPHQKSVEQTAPSASHREPADVAST